MKFQVRYGINRTERKPHRRRIIYHENHSIVVELSANPLDSPATFQQLYKVLIEERHPGWQLTGYTCEEVSTYGSDPKTEAGEPSGGT